MRLLRPFAIAASLVLVVAGVSAACTVQSAFVSGKFDENGAFQVVSALDSQGNKLDGVDGKTFAKVELGENVAMPASGSADLVYVVADLDFDNNVMRVASSTSCAKTADAAVASAQAGGDGCCAAKAASVKTAGSGCGTAAKTANAGSGCGSAAKSASYANAGSGCGTAAKSAGYANAGSGCGSSAKAANTASASSGCSPSAKGAEYTMVVFKVSGMTCGGCASKIEAAVAALEMKGVEAVVVDVEGGTATIRTSSDVCTKTLESAITKAGFPAEIALAEAPETAAKS